MKASQDATWKGEAPCLVGYDFGWSMQSAKKTVNKDGREIGSMYSMRRAGVRRDGEGYNLFTCLGGGQSRSAVWRPVLCGKESHHEGLEARGSKGSRPVRKISNCLHFFQKRQGQFVGPQIQYAEHYSTVHSETTYPYPNRPVSIRLMVPTGLGRWVVVFHLNCLVLKCT